MLDCQCEVISKGPADLAIQITIDSAHDILVSLICWTASSLYLSQQLAVLTAKTTHLKVLSDALQALVLILNPDRVFVSV
jgi:hypothetical protein